MHAVRETNLRTLIVTIALALASTAFGQDPEPPVLEQLKGTFACTNHQTAAGDVVKLELH